MLKIDAANNLAIRNMISRGGILVFASGFCTEYSVNSPHFVTQPPNLVFVQYQLVDARTLLLIPVGFRQVRGPETGSGRPCRLGPPEAPVPSSTTANTVA